MNSDMHQQLANYTSNSTNHYQEDQLAAFGLFLSKLEQFNEIQAITHDDKDDAQRMQVNQVTFAILIGVLTVADMILIWTFGYIVIYYEKCGKFLLKQSRALIRTAIINESAQRKTPKTVIKSYKELTIEKLRKSNQRSA